MWNNGTYENARHNVGVTYKMNAGHTIQHKKDTDAEQDDDDDDDDDDPRNKAEWMWRL